MMFSGIRLFYLLFILLSFVLAIYPSADIGFSSIFYKGNNQFFVQHYLVSSVYFYEFLVRNVMMPLIIVFLLFFPILIKLSKYLKNKFHIYNFKIRDILFVWISALLIAVLINFVLKNLWGRARPVDTIIFDGEKIFTPWTFYSTQCLDNCSFVSGDASVGFFIACLYYVTNNNKFLYFSIIVGLIIGVVRIGAGAHFLSDILMSFVVVNIVLQFTRYLFIKWEKTKT